VAGPNKYKIGDLVVCKYDYEYLYYPGMAAQLVKKPFFIGIILSVRDDRFIFFDRETVYEVLCIDGRRRFFTTWEVEVLRVSHFS
jgi:hypothetical protein